MKYAFIMVKDKINKQCSPMKIISFRYFFLILFYLYYYSRLSNQSVKKKRTQNIIKTYFYKEKT